MTIVFDEEEQNQKLKELREREKEESIQTSADEKGLPYINLTAYPINADALRLIPETEARAAQMTAFSLENKDVGVAAVLPEDEIVKKILEKLSLQGFNPTLFLASMESLEAAWQNYKELSFAVASKVGAFDISTESINFLISSLKTIEDVKKSIEEKLLDKKGQISRVLEIVLSGALAAKASDIHIEPEETGTRLRYRLDGVLHDTFRFDEKTFNFILSRIKLLSGLKLNVKNEAQDGRFSIIAGKKEVEVRTSVIPGAYGESIVMRILDPDSISMPLEELGIHPKLLKILEEEIKKPKGMILTTGPTGSGKTTTLYACLKKVYTPEVKIITIENPVEYHVQGIVQTQIESEKGYSFLEGLRSALRQDPDVIMVGEIRDEETARTAIDAALTGHLVFSTLHTNNAAGAFTRLVDLGVNPKVITSAVSIAMAQRLARRLCNACKKEVKIEGENKKIVENAISCITDKGEIKNSEKMWVAVGCEKCNGTGYKGRIGIYEAIIADESIEKIVRKNPSEREIKKVALAQEIYSMLQDGIIKVLSGVTSLDELGRVVGLMENI